MAHSLVKAAWLAENLDDPNLRVIEIDRDDLDAYQSGHIPGAIGWHWKSMLWDPRQRQFPSPQDFTQRLGDAGITNDTAVILCGVPVQFGTYAWWVFKYLGHKNVRLLDGGMTKWKRDGSPLSSYEDVIFG